MKGGRPRCAHFPTQNWEKIWSSRVSVAFAPVMRESRSIASCRQTAPNSSGAPEEKADRMGKKR